MAWQHGMWQLRQLCDCVERVKEWRRQAPHNEDWQAKPSGAAACQTMACRDCAHAAMLRLRGGRAKVATVQSHCPCCLRRTQKYSPAATPTPRAYGLNIWAVAEKLWAAANRPPAATPPPLATAVADIKLAAGDPAAMPAEPKPTALSPSSAPVFAAAGATAATVAPATAASAFVGTMPVK